MAFSLRCIIARVLEIDPALLDETSGMNVTENWDSLNQLMIVTAIEQELGTRLAFSDLEEASSLRAIRERLRQQRIPIAD